MQRISVRIPHLYRNSLFVVLLTSWSTGIVFFVLSRWMSVEGEFGQEKHPWQYPTLKIHGAAAFLMMMAFGSIIAAHIPTSWKLKRLRGIGVFLVATVGLQIVSAYCLYYLSDEQWRFWTANFHAALGVSLPFVLITHVVMGIKTRRRFA